MDTHSINNDPDLKNCPFGAISVEPHTEEDGRRVLRVFITHPVTERRHFLGYTNPKRAVSPTTFLCGNRPYEVEHFTALRKRVAERQQKSYERVREDTSKDFRREVRAFLHKTVDGRDQLIDAFQGRGRR